MFNTDSIYVIGHNHKINEDYAYDGVVPNINGDISYAIISDGCSGGNDCVDMGARLLVHGFKNFLRKMGRNIHYYHGAPSELYNDLCYHLKRTIHNSAESVGLSPYSFVATIRAMVVIKDKLFCFHFGDGYTLHQSKVLNSIAETQFSSNAPYYFMNHIDKRERDNYCNTYQHYTITHNGFIIDNPVYYINSDKHFYHVMDLNSLPIGDHIFSVVSDGIDTFYTSDEDGKQVNIPVSTIHGKAFAFKNFQGEFIQRRFNRFFKDMQKENIKHFDDFSVASIHYSKKEE